MRKSAAIAVLVIASSSPLVACSSAQPHPELGADELAVGTAVVSIGGAEVATSRDVSCTPAGAVTTIVTGADGQGTTSAVDAEGGLVAKYVEIRDMGGFSGSFWEGVGDAPEVRLSGRTFILEGTAMGYRVGNPSARVAEKYRIRVGC